MRKLELPVVRRTTSLDELAKAFKDIVLKPAEPDAFYRGFSPRLAEELLDQAADLLERADANLARVTDLHLQQLQQLAQLQLLHAEIRGLEGELEEESLRYDSLRMEGLIAEADQSMADAKSQLNHLVETEGYYDPVENSDANTYIYNLQVAAVTSIDGDGPTRLSQAREVLSRLSPRLDSWVGEPHPAVNGLENLGKARIYELENELRDRKAAKKQAQAHVDHGPKRRENLEQQRDALLARHALHERLAALQAAEKRIQDEIEATLDVPSEIEALTRLALQDIAEAAKRIPATHFGLSSIYGVAQRPPRTEGASPADLLTWVRNSISEVIQRKHASEQGVVLIEVPTTQLQGTFEVQPNEWLPAGARLTSLTAFSNGSEVSDPEALSLRVTLPSQVAGLTVTTMDEVLGQPVFPPRYTSVTPVEKRTQCTIAPLLPLESNVQAPWFSDSSNFMSTPFGVWDFAFSKLPSTRVFLALRYVKFVG